MATTQLRGGYTTEDRRLDRLPQFDPASRRWGVAPITAGAQRSYTWGFRGPQLDQGIEGACVGFSWSQELICNPVYQSGITDAFARQRVYWEAQRIDPWEGGAYPGAVPFYEGTSVLAGVQVIQRLGACQNYRWAFSLDEVISGVGYAGPCVLGVNWYSGMMNTNASGYLIPSGGVVGGHAVLCRGVSLRYRRFILQNSWGSDWGMNGAAYISFDDLGRLLSEQGEACFPVSRQVIAA